MLRPARNFEERVHNDRAIRKLLSRVVRFLGRGCRSTIAVTKHLLLKGAAPPTLPFPSVPPLIFAAMAGDEECATGPVQR